MEKTNLNEEIITLNGMHCKSCAELIENRLSMLKGVEKIKVSFPEEKAFVQFDPEIISLDLIKKEIESVGYKTDFNDISENISNHETGLSKKSIFQGIAYGLLPHTGCIAFIIFSIFGVTVATQFFKPFLLNPYFFYILIAISFVFATVSAIVYLKRQGLIEFNRGEGGSEISFSSGIIKRKWKYLSTLYGTTIGINLLLFMVIFPLLANVSFGAPSITGAFVGTTSSIRLKVDIPCSGHAPLITQELKSINGVVSVQFSFPNIFDVTYDSAKTTKEQILSLDVFNTYKATVLNESSSQNVVSANSVTSNSITTVSDGTNATVINGVQTIQLSVQGSNYYPNPIRVKIGIPVQLIADVNNMPGCSKSIIIPEFGIRKTVSASDNIIEFTPNKSGTFQFSCSMGMFRGQIIVENADGSVAAYVGNTSVTSSGSCGASGGGCGCGCGVK